MLNAKTLSSPPQKVLRAMISRRNIRVKVMQTLYTISTLENDIKTGEPLKLLQQHFDQTRSLFVYLIYFLTEVSRYAETNAHQRASKHLPTADDSSINRPTRSEACSPSAISVIMLASFN